MSLIFYEPFLENIGFFDATVTDSGNFAWTASGPEGASRHCDGVRKYQCQTWAQGPYSTDHSNRCAVGWLSQSQYYFDSGTYVSGHAHR